MNRTSLTCAALLLASAWAVTGTRVAADRIIEINSIKYELSKSSAGGNPFQLTNPQGVTGTSFDFAMKLINGSGNDVVISDASGQTGLKIRNTQSPAAVPLRADVAIPASGTATIHFACPADASGAIGSGGEWIFAIGDGPAGKPDATLRVSVDCNAPPVQPHWYSHTDWIANATQEVPTNASPGKAYGTIEVDTINNKLHFDITSYNLTSTEIAAHIHGPANPGQNAGVLFGLPAGQHKVGTWDYPEALEADILAGRTYVNIHTVNNSGGEIRGQIQPTAKDVVPGVEGWGLILLASMLALGGVGYLMLRSRARTA